MMNSEILIEKLEKYPTYTIRILELNKRLSDIVGMRGNYDECIPSASVVNDMPKGDGEPDQTYSALMSLENVLIRYKKDIKELSAEILELMDEKDMIDRILRSLLPNDNRIIELRHFQGRTWEWISANAFYSRPWLPKVHRKIIINMVKEWNLRIKYEKDLTQVNI